MGSEEDQEANNGATETGSAEQQRKVWWFNERLPIDRFTGWLVAWTFMLFLATIGSGIVLILTEFTLKDTLVETKKSADAANRAAKSAEDTLIATQRPWISAEIKLGSAPLTYDAIGVSLSLKVSMKNVKSSRHPT